MWSKRGHGGRIVLVVSISCLKGEVVVGGGEYPYVGCFRWSNSVHTYSIHSGAESAMMLPMEPSSSPFSSPIDHMRQFCRLRAWLGSA